MVECNTNESECLKDCNDVRALTGDKESKRQLYYQLKASLKKAEQIDILVSFVMESGVRMIMPDLISAVNRGAKVRMLTGSYLV